MKVNVNIHLLLYLFEKKCFLVSFFSPKGLSLIIFINFYLMRYLQLVLQLRTTKSVLLNFRIHLRHFRLQSFYIVKRKIHIINSLASFILSLRWNLASSWRISISKVSILLGKNLSQFRMNIFHVMSNGRD